MLLGTVRINAPRHAVRGVMPGSTPAPRYRTSMPSELPRVTAYIQPETRAALDAASEALGQSRSKLVAELLDSAVPILQAVTDAALVVRDHREMQREAMQRAAEEMAELKVSSEDLQARVVDIMARLGEKPPPTNRGVTF